jgi:hypothetical protein
MTVDEGAGLWADTSTPRRASGHPSELPRRFEAGGGLYFSATLDRQMPRYHFKLVDSRRVSDYGVHELIDDTIAQIEATKTESGVGICVIPIDEI